MNHVDARTGVTKVDRLRLDVDVGQTESLNQVEDDVTLRPIEGGLAGGACERK
jgi:hypothetical protein